MPKLEGIIDAFNYVLKTKELTAQAFQLGKFNGIVTRITDSEGKITFSDDNGNQITVDDKNPFQCFYTCLTSQDDATLIDTHKSRTIYSMLMYVYYNKKRLSVSKFDLNYMIRRNMLVELPKSASNNSGVSSVQFRYINSNYDSTQISTNSFGGKIFDPSNVIFTIAFNVIVTANKTCELCVNCN